MNVTIYYADGSIESCTTPYQQDIDFDHWRVDIKASTKTKATWCVGVDQIGENRASKGPGGETRQSIELASVSNARSRDGYVSWLEDNVLSITVDGYPFWPMGGIDGD